ncbi:MAG: PH domain-containing protein [Methanomicrobiales archaeon]|jgi:membrane protein YdbS with pleckstrin-like domain|nr:PH domain-containing protein [Methanomicrobiales archaeon]
MQHIILGEDFKPSLQYRLYLAITLGVIVVFAWLMVTYWTYIVAEEGFTRLIPIIVTTVFIALLVFILVWVVLYYRSVVYHLNKTEMTWKRGVWFWTTGIVPYNRITNVDIVQGPVMRLFHISSLRIQTAGASADGAPEIALTGIEEPEALRALIMDFVRGQPSVSAVTGAETSGVSFSANQDISALLEEVAMIRKLLESKL